MMDEKYRRADDGVVIKGMTAQPNVTAQRAVTGSSESSATFGHGIIVEANYPGSAGHKLYNITNVSRFAGDLLTDNLFNGWNRSFSAIDMIEASSNSIHHGGTVQVRKMFTTGLTLQGAYTYGKTINDSDELVAAVPNNGNPRCRTRRRRL